MLILRIFLPTVWTLVWRFNVLNMERTPGVGGVRGQ